MYVCRPCVSQSQAFGEKLVVDSPPVLLLGAILGYNRRLETRLRQGWLAATGSKVARQYHLTWQRR